MIKETFINLTLTVSGAPMRSMSLMMSFILLALLSLAVGCKTDRHVLAHRDEITNQSSNIAAFAYQYRLRPTATQGGNGSYLGLELPERMRTSENATYEFHVLSPDTIFVIGRSTRDTTNAITTCFDKEGRSFAWMYVGAFKK